MAFSPHIGEFAKLLQQLQDAHVAEVDMLQKEIVRLRDTTESHEDAGAEQGPRPGLHDAAPLVSMSAPEIVRLRDTTESNEDAGAEHGPRPGLHDAAPSVSMSAPEIVRLGYTTEFNEDAGAEQGPRPGHHDVASSVSISASVSSWEEHLPNIRRGTSFTSSSSDGLKHILAPKRNDNFKIEMRRPSAILKRLVESSLYETTFCVLIFLNAVIMAVEVQYVGIEVGYQLDYPKSHESAADTWPGAKHILEIASLLFGLLFTVEIVLKCVGLRLQFWFELWNWIDLALVMLWVLGQLESFVGSVLPNLNSSMFRLARLGRLLRLIRLVRKIQGFDSLLIMTTAIRGSMSVLFWTFILLSMVQMMLTLFLLQFLHEYYFNDPSYPLEQRQDVFTYYGTFFRAFFSMFELTLANWPPCVRILAQNVNEVFFVFGLMHKLSIGFAVVGVINGVFMQETFKVASMDDVLMVRHKERASKLHHEKMMRFLEEADRSDRDGFISKEEFYNIVKDPQVKMWFSAMELGTGDPVKLFTLIDRDGNGQIFFDELVAGVNDLRGPARQIDVITMMQDMQRSITLIKPYCSTPIARSLEGDANDLFRF